MYHLQMAVSQCQNSSAPFDLSIASSTVSLLLFLITIPTNLLVCLAILIDPNNQLRTQFNCFTFNLALADLLVGCLTQPVSAYAHITEALDTERRHKVKSVVLKLFHIPYFISAMASVLSISALALERYLAITSPFRYRQHFNVSLTVILSVAIWIIAVGFGLFNIFVDFILGSFIFVNTGVLFTGVVVCYVSFKIRSTLRQVSNNWTEIGIQCTRAETVQNMKLTKTFALMTGALMFCYVPACSMIYYMNLCQDCDCGLIQWFRDASFWLILLNSAINPFVYAIRSSSFRNAIRQILRCRCRHKESRGANMRYGSFDTGADEKL